MNETRRNVDDEYSCRIIEGWSVGKWMKKMQHNHHLTIKKPDDGKHNSLIGKCNLVKTSFSRPNKPNKAP